MTRPEGASPDSDFHYPPSRASRARIISARVSVDRMLEMQTE